MAKTKHIKSKEAEVTPSPEVPQAHQLTSAEAGALHAAGHRFTTPPKVTEESYAKLLSAYTKLKQRARLDAGYEKQLDKEAGLG